MNLNKIVHSMCCTLAGLYNLSRQASITFIPNAFIGKNHHRSDFLPVPVRHVAHPADPDG